MQAAKAQLQAYFPLPLSLHASSASSNGVIRYFIIIIIITQTLYSGVLSAKPSTYFISSHIHSCFHFVTYTYTSLFSVGGAGWHPENNPYTHCIHLPLTRTYLQACPFSIYFTFSCPFLSHLFIYIFFFFLASKHGFLSRFFVHLK